MTLDPTYLSSFVLIGTAFTAAFLVALWLSLIFWTYRDIRKRARDPFMIILGVLIVAALFLPGVLIYLIIRPASTNEEDYQHTLEEEALLQTIEDNPLCSACGRRVRDDWIACPHCHTVLKKKCRSCNRLLEIPWDLCPFCAAQAPGKASESERPDDSPQNPSTLHH
jgi:RNA polymerase subunit RPABC4/transcription elongation factor Spt4